MDVTTVVRATRGTRLASVATGMLEGAAKGGAFGTATAAMVLTGQIQTGASLARPGAMRQAAILTAVSTGLGTVTGAIAGGIRGALHVAA